MQIKIIDTNLQVRYQKINNKLVILNNKYNIHLKLYACKRRQKYAVGCKVKDRKTMKTVFTKVFFFDEKVNLEQIKSKILERHIPKKLEEIEKYVICAP